MNYFDSSGHHIINGGVKMNNISNPESKQEDREQLIELGSDITKNKQGNKCDYSQECYIL
jgi:hypothetical protein